jgi:hypothetical protein
MKKKADYSRRPKRILLRLILTGFICMSTREAYCKRGKGVKEEMGRDPGLEPVTNGIRIRCSAI